MESPLALLLPQLDQAISQAVEPPGIPALCADGGMAVVQPVRDQPGAVVRVAAQKLDLLLTRSAELVAIAARADDKRDDALTALRMLVKECRAKDRMPSRGLKHLAGELNRFGAAVDADTAAIAHAAAALDAEIRRVRMQPFSAACEGFERIVRDLCLACAKDADLVIEGGNIELDRSIIERVKDPLLHLLRNAVDHGIEPASVRRAAGKPPTGRITVGAALRGARVEVTVADDGPGLDLASIRAAADARHLPPAEGHDLAQYVFLPGFTTAEIVTEVSGRGVGLDAVKTSAEAMRGSADVTFAPDRGTTFVLTLPLTLTTIRAVLVEAKGQCFALDVALVERVLRADRGRLTNVEDRTFILSEDGAVPVVSLSNMLGLTGKPAEAKGDQTLPLVLLAADNRRIALLVDKFLGEQEILVRSLGKRLIRVRYLSGGTTLPGGRIAFILNVPDLVRNARRRVPLPIMEEPAQASSSATRTRVLLADDSLTTRTLERSILEVAGYEVIAAADGREAWRLLQEQGADIVVSDIEMPFMDGIALTDAIRRSPRFKELPVILVTASRASRTRCAAFRPAQMSIWSKAPSTRRACSMRSRNFYDEGEAMIRVIIASASIMVREAIADALRADPELTILAGVSNGIEALERVRRMQPDLLVIDAALPKLDGFETTKRIMTECPTPIVILSEEDDAREVELSLHALRAGALGVCRRPPPQSPGWDAARAELVATAKAMSRIKLVRRWPTRKPFEPARGLRGTPHRIVAIAASTGGPAALQRLLADIPADFLLPILIVQHIAAGFVGGLASWLNTETSLEVTVAEHGGALAPRTAYIAPDDFHLGVTWDARIALSRAAPIRGVRPSADFLLQSAAQAFGASVIAVILTGMGEDGSEGARAVRTVGGCVLVQDEATSVVFGMPRAAVEAGLANEVLPLTAIAPRLAGLVCR